MTRASLLHILDHVNGISDAEIRELEQLAAAFPYCQTAHVLLAKAAHDRGSMLASQRLRRAATYASDRELLRQLLEQPPAPVIYAPPAGTEPASAPLAPALVPSEPAETAAPEAPVTAEAVEEAAPEVAAEAETAPAEAAPLLAESPAPREPQPLDAEQTSEATEVESVQESAEPDPLPATTVSAADAVVETAETLPEPEVVTELPEPETPQVAAEPVLAESEEITAAAPDDDILPAAAPPIRPPADAGISRFEFGLSQPDPLEPVAYQLPGLDEDEADDELPTLSGLKAPPAPVAPFRADADLGYALGAGSRLGYDLQAHDGYTLDLPLDAFFEPDALLLAHLKAHTPKPAASSLDLINRFLKTQPRIKTPVGVPLPAEQQPDLSVRSTSAAPAIASESLAKIMVRQGKKDKAIEIYERLMERQPEKKAYFAEQIQQLQQPSE